MLLAAALSCFHWLPLASLSPAGWAVVIFRGGPYCLHTGEHFGATAHVKHFSAACGHLHYACRPLPQASCSLLSALRLLLWLRASWDAGVRLLDEGQRQAMYQ